MTTRETHAGIDALLGPAEGRFFGSGYRRVEQRLWHSGTEQAGATTVRTDRAAIDYPRDWSTKKPGTGLRPHLSTIDATVLAGLIAESHLRSWAGLTSDEVARAWIRSLSLRAGPAAQESVDTIEIRTAIVERGDGSAPAYEFTSEMGSMRTTYVVELPRAPGEAGPETVFTAGLVSGADQPGIALHDVELDVPARTAVAAVRFLDEAGRGGPPAGLAAAHRPFVTDVQNILAVAQTAQALLYRIDDVARADSNTLWTRVFTASRTGPPRRRDGADSVTVAVLDHEHLPKGGEIWSASSWRGSCADVTTTFEVAHRLPEAGL
ncbi:AvrD family protein [Amycolatopsis sp. NBC_00345]|uniref:AvrD family protein n=1 Tax=Amycolatopsis sp. NBC_00345 TaxID=2975955 RepID=UPI002E2589F3